MISNFVRVAIRNMRKYRIYSFINIVGLAVGMACVMLIFLFVQDELNYDQFYPQGDNIYRVASKGKIGDRNFDACTICAPFSPTAVSEFPEVEKAVRLYFRDNVLLTYEKKQFLEDRLLRADSNFFEIFSRPFIYGDPENALKGSRSMVLTQSSANRYFGKHNPVGKLLRMGQGNVYTITGVVEDVPDNSHFHYDLVIPLELSPEDADNWLTDYMQAYLLLKPGTDYKFVESKFPDFVLRHLGSRVKEKLGMDLEAWKREGNDFTYYLEPLKSIYLYSTVYKQLEPVSDIKYVYIFSAIAFFILLLACVNFLNLTTARSFTRAKEVGIRKVFGGTRPGLMIQFLAETFYLALLSGVLAYFLVELLMPFFNQISRKALSSQQLWESSSLLFMVGMILVVVIFAGSYTAFTLSGFKIQSVLRGVVRSHRVGKSMRASLVVFQFAVAIGILISSFIIRSQVNYMQNKKLGFSKEHILVVDRSDVLSGEQQKTIKEELKAFSTIEGVSFSWNIPGRGTSGWGMYGEGANPEDLINFRTMSVDDEFLDVMSVDLKKGRFFNADRLSDTAKVVVNEAALKVLGYSKGIGRKVFFPGYGLERESLEIIGVMKNFHFNSMRDKIYPMLLFYGPNSPKRYMLVRLSPGSAQQSIKFVKKRWDKMTASHPFIYFFLDNDFNNLFKGEVRIANILEVFTLLAFLIALMGLLGLVSFEMQQRVKEIGIRKVLGSSEKELVLLLSKNLCSSVLLGNFIAWPITWYFMNQWLDNFVYRISFPWYYFLLALVISIVLALLTVTSHSLKASRANPVDSLRYE